VKTFNFPQYSPEWWSARLGVITASDADKLVTPAEFRASKGKGVETYMYEKLAEKLLGHAQDESGSSFAMDQGSMAEKLALPWFNFTFDAEVKMVGFCLTDDGRCGCSPDGISEAYGLEIKFPTAPVHLKYLMEGRLPVEYGPQVHFSMFVTGKPLWKFVSFSRVFEPLVVDIPRDEEKQDAIAEAVAAFGQKFDAAYAKIKAMKDAENAQRQAAYNAEVAAHAK